VRPDLVKAHPPHFQAVSRFLRSALAAASSRFLYGLGDVGYSRLFMPDTAAALKPSGLIVGFGGGFRFPLYGRAFFGMSVGAQFGFQGLSLIHI
jgi:hypothetical protein